MLRTPKKINFPIKNKMCNLKLRHYEKATKLKNISHLFWQNSCFYSVASKHVGDFFKFLWPSQKSWTLLFVLLTKSQSQSISFLITCLKSNIQNNSFFLFIRQSLVFLWRPQELKVVTYLIWHLLSKRQIKWVITPNFCSLLRKAQL